MKEFKTADLHKQEVLILYNRQSFLYQRVEEVMDDNKAFFLLTILFRLKHWNITNVFY